MVGIIDPTGCEFCVNPKASGRPGILARQVDEQEYPSYTNRETRQNTRRNVAMKRLSAMRVSCRGLAGLGIALAMTVAGQADEFVLQLGSTRVAESQDVVSQQKTFQPGTPPERLPRYPPLPNGNKSSEKKPALQTPKENKALPEVPPFRDLPFGTVPHYGTSEDGGVGYRHYDFPNYRYGIWYRPRGFGWGIAERCAPQPFRPRGYGNLFNEPSTRYRMDYNRYVLTNYRTDYGPSYYRRHIDQRCDTYDHSHHFRPGCDPSRLRETQVWTLGRHDED